MEITQEGTALMSMFDYLVCERELPIPQVVIDDCPDEKWDEAQFQTKSLGSARDDYEISEEGVLYIHDYELRIDENERTPFGPKTQRIDKGILEQEYTGELLFYSDFVGKESDHWLEFKALFWKGAIKELSLEKHQQDDPKERIELEKLLADQFSQIKERHDSVWYKILHWVALPIVFVLSLVRWVLGLIIKLTFALQRWIT